MGNCSVCDIYLHIQAYAYIPTSYIATYINASYMNIRTYICVYIYIYQQQTYIYIYIYVRTYVIIYIHFITCTHTYLYAYIRKDIHKCGNRKQVFKEDMLKISAAE
jgi:hypothetical protein